MSDKLATMDHNPWCIALTIVGPYVVSTNHEPAGFGRPADNWHTAVFRRGETTLFDTAVEDADESSKTLREGLTTHQMWVDWAYEKSWIVVALITR